MRKGHTVYDSNGKWEFTAWQMVWMGLEIGWNWYIECVHMIDNNLGIGIYTIYEIGWKPSMKLV